MPLGFEPPMGGAYPDEVMASPYVGEGQEIFRPDAYSQFIPPEEQPPPESVSEYVSAEPPPPSKEFQKKAFKYITEFCRASAEFMVPHIQRAERNWRWYRGKLSIRDLEEDRLLGRASSGQSRTDPSTGRMQKDGTDKRSDFLYPIQPAADAIVSYSYLSIFSGPDYLTLSNEDDEGEHSGEDLTRKNEVVKRLLLKKHRLGRYKSNMRPLLIDWVVTGTAISVTFYYEHKVRKFRELVIDGEPTGEVEEYEETVYACPITQGIKLTRFLPDPKATTTDVNRWRGVGHIVKKTYDEVIQDFKPSVTAEGTTIPPYYHLNQAEFEKRFKEAGSSDDDTQSPLEHEDGDAATTETREDGVSDLTLVEWQGKIPDGKRGMIEVVAVIAYEKNKDTEDTTFTTGLLIRLSEQTISTSGLRTVNTCHWAPGNGPIGLGLPDSHTELLYQASQFMGQIHDTAAYTCTGAYGILDHDKKAQAEIAKDPVLSHGRFVKMMQEGSIFALPHPDTADMGKLQAIIEQLLAVVERSSGAEEPTQDVASDMKATVFTGLQQRSQAPGTVRTQAFAEEIITATSNLSLSFLQSQTFDDQTVLAPDFDSGQDVPMVVTREDLQRGKWVVEASLTNMDQSQMAAAQIMKDLLLQTPMLKETFASEGKDFMASECAGLILTQVKAQNTNRIIRTIQPREQMLMDQNQQLQQQLMEMEQMLHGAGGPGPQGGNGKEPPPGMNGGGNMPQGFGMNGGPKGPAPTDDNMLMLQQQLEAAGRAGVPM